MADDEFTKLFKYMQARFDKIDTLLDEMVTKTEINNLVNAVDGLTKRVETDDQERVAMNHQLNRHENWIGRASKKLKISYDN